MTFLKKRKTLSLLLVKTLLLYNVFDMFKKVQSSSFEWQFWAAERVNDDFHGLRLIWKLLNKFSINLLNLNIRR